jgi:hypothetical protein
MSPSQLPGSQGFRNEALRAALAAALGGRPAALEDLLSRLGRGDSPRPNLRLAAAFGAELAASKAAPGAVPRLLAALGASDADPDDPRVFLPVAAAHGWVALLQTTRDQQAAWSALAELAADARTPVRLGALDALATFVGRDAGRRADELVGRALSWLEHPDREVRFGATAVVVEVFADPRALAALARSRSLLDYLSRAIDAIAEAPRSAERSDARRRLLLALPRTLGAVVGSPAQDDLGARWFEGECARAVHPDVREALSSTLVRLGSGASTAGAVVSEQLRPALEASAKPPRDPTRRRPGAARGKASRPIR